MTRRKIYTAMTMLLLTVLNGAAQQLMNGQVAVRNLHITRGEHRIFVTMDMDVTKLDVSRNNEVFLTPVLRAEEQEVRFPSVLLAGRSRYYVHQRNAKDMPENTTLYRASETDTIHYEASIPYSPWMRRGALTIDEDQCGCQCEVLADNNELLTAFNFEPKQFQPLFVYLPPKAEGVKLRELRGQAYIDFPVNRTEIYPEYRRNPAELQKIRHTIDTVRNDADVRITSISIKGYASPESPYSNNTRLAKGRTETLKNYVKQLYHFDEALFHTDFEPEDWAGLRRYVENSGLEHRAEILTLIDSDQEPDAKEKSIRSRYPKEYQFLLKECYPALRHSDYVVEYIVKAYTDVEEAKRVLRTAPGKLSLQEFYMVANSYQPGSDEYNELFRTMVRLYPEDEVANLNAANVAMNRGDLVGAKPYLDKAGTSAHALYARGVYHALNKEYTEARSLLQQAEAKGLTQAREALQQIEEILEEQSEMK